MSSIRKQYVQLLLARGITLIVGFLSSFVFVRYMSQETFGQYKYLTNYYTTLSTFVVLGLPYTASRLLVQTDSHDRMRQIYGYTLRLLSGIGLLSSVLLVIVLWVLRQNGSEIPFYLIASTPFFYTLLIQTAFLTMLQGSNRISDISLQTLLPSLSLLLLIWLIGMRQGLLDLRTVMIIHIVCFTVLHLFSIFRLKVDFSRGDLTISREFRAEFKANGSRIYLGSLIGVASGYLINLILGAVSGMAEYGLFGLALSISAPMQFIPSVMGTVSFRSNAKSDQLTRNNLLFTLLLSVASLGAYLLFLKLLFPLYPDNFAAALPYAQILAVYFTAMGLGDYFHRFISAHGFGQIINRGAIVTGLVNILASYVLIRGFMVTGAAVARTISGLAYLAYMSLAYSYVSRQLRSSERLEIEAKDE